MEIGIEIEVSKVANGIKLAFLVKSSGSIINYNKGSKSKNIIYQKIRKIYKYKNISNKIKIQFYYLN
jgi:hypothetical protein